MAKRPSKEQWLEARQAWEADPTVTFVEIGKRLGVSHTAVIKAAKRDGWVKSGNLASINRSAQVRADSVSGEVSGEVSHETIKKPLPASIEQSTELRAKLIQAHRAEWRKHAKLFPLEQIAEDFELGKRAKISAEMISIRQRGERIAWGMDEEGVKDDVVIRWVGSE